MILSVLNSLEPAQNKTRSEKAALHCSPADEALAVLVVTMAVALVALLLPLLLPTAEAVVVVEILVVKYFRKSFSFLSSVSSALRS